MKIEFTKRILYINDLKEYIILVKQNLMLISSNLFFEITKHKIEIRSDKIKIVHSHNSLYDNFLKIITKNSWTNNEIKEIMGYLSIMNLIISLNENDKSTTNNLYNCVYSILANYKIAYKSDQDIDQYKDELLKYNQLSLSNKIDIAMGGLNKIYKPKNPDDNISELVVYNIDAIFNIGHPLEFLSKINNGDELHSSGDDVVFKQGNLMYTANVSFNYNENIRNKDSIKYKNLLFRVQSERMNNGKTSSVFRICARPPIHFELI